MDRTLIEKYAAGAEVPREAIEGLSTAELNGFPVPGTWSIQQIVLHLMDSDLIASDRMKRIIAEDSPTITAYDESAFSRRLHYDKLDVHLACETFRLNRLLTAQLLRTLPNADFERTGNHTERGRISLVDLVRSYTDHLTHHLKFIHQKRGLLGKPS